MAEPRTINKYPNRRLYDTSRSSYITLEDVRQLVLNRQPFQVVDKKTGRQITRNILLQVIAEQEQRGPSVLSEGFLLQVILAHGDLPSPPIAGFLEERLSALLEGQPEGPAQQEIGGQRNADASSDR
jgi:polyhydroxyalkanoate synthesis repressor PhaR